MHFLEKNWSNSVFVLLSSVSVPVGNPGSVTAQDLRGLSLRGAQFPMKKWSEKSPLFKCMDNIDLLEKIF